MRIEAALDRYVTQLRADGRSPLTIDQIERQVLVLARWLAAEKLPTDVRRLTHEHVARFLASDAARLRPDGKAKLETAMNTMRSSLRTFFGYVNVAGFAPRNAAGLVRRARVGPRPPRAFTMDETERLVAALDAAKTVAQRRDRALFRFMLATGARLTSTLQARVEDLDLPGAVVDLRAMKGGGTLTVPLDGPTRDLLAEHLAGRTEGPLFPGRGGEHMGRRSTAERFKAWLRKAGIARKGSPHCLRHTCATRIFENGRDLLEVQRRLGHRSIVSSAVYAGGERW